MSGWAAHILAVCSASTAAVLPIAIQAQDEARFDIAISAGRLDDALRSLARQTGVAVGSTGSSLPNLRTPSVSGRLTAAQALSRLLAGSGYRAVRVARNVYRIERAPRPISRPAPRPSAPVQRQAPPPAPALPEPIPEPIIVSASKRATRLADYPGAVTVIDLGSANSLLPDGLDALIEQVPQTSGTNLGAGRNKIFMRGIADSSFNGPTQSTTGLYLGEQRLIYSAPNPDLPLYDMHHVELLEGPQGTLYGAGSLGGVIRLAPQSPKLGELSAAISSSVTVTQHGEASFDNAVVANAPVSENAAIRLLAYGKRQGGYIDNPERALENINRSSLIGFRGALLLDFDGNWQAVATGFGQRNHMRDGQYIDADLPGLQRVSLVDQPFTSRLLGGNVTLSGEIGEAELVSTTGLVQNTLDTRYDSSRLAGPPARQAYDEARDIALFSHETRIVSPQNDGFSWLAGFSALRNRDKVNQLVTNLEGDNPPPFADINYSIDELALFGEGTFGLGEGLSATLGARLVYSRSESLRRFGANVAEDSDGPLLRALPMAALSWHPSEDWLVYLRYQRGYRTGGVTVERRDDGTPIPTRFDADKLQSAELGMRKSLTGPISGEIAVAGFYTHWSDIQGDLVQAQGFPITRNIGDGSILGLTASAQLRLAGPWRLEGAIFANRNRIERRTPSQMITNQKLPNVADFSGRIALGADVPLGHGQELNVKGFLSYSGASWLDISPDEQLPQGKVLDSGLSASFQDKDWQVSLEVTNLLNIRANRFAFGNPFDVRQVNQHTPLRPRSLKLAVSRFF